jgi:hypothetical protein
MIRELVLVSLICSIMGMVLFLLTGDATSIKSLSHGTRMPPLVLFVGKYSNSAPATALPMVETPLMASNQITYHRTKGQTSQNKLTEKADFSASASGQPHGTSISAAPESATMAAKALESFLFPSLVAALLPM